MNSRNGKPESVENDRPREPKRRDVVRWWASSAGDSNIFEIKVEGNITIILIDTRTGCVFIAYNPRHDQWFVRLFSGMPQLLSYLEIYCSDGEKYVLKDPEYDSGAYIHRRDLLDILVKCMAKIPRYSENE